LCTSCACLVKLPCVVCFLKYFIPRFLVYHGARTSRRSRQRRLPMPFDKCQATSLKQLPWSDQKHLSGKKILQVASSYWWCLWMCKEKVCYRASQSVTSPVLVFVNLHYVFLCLFLYRLPSYHSVQVSSSPTWRPPNLSASVWLPVFFCSTLSLSPVFQALQFFFPSFPTKE
jgi:hypothetical protein